MAWGGGSTVVWESGPLGKWAIQFFSGDGACLLGGGASGERSVTSGRSTSATTRWGGWVLEGLLGGLAPNRQ